MIPSSPLYQIGGKRVSFCVAFLMLLALFLIPVKTFARYEIIDEMRYNIIDDYAVLASNTDWKYTGDIVVPQKATASDGKKYPVTALEEGCFRDCKTVTSVLLPSSITKIGEYCFCGCIHLQRVNIPSSVTSLGKSTFSGCSSLTSIEIPSNVKYLGNSCFVNCSSLTSINIPSSITSLAGCPRGFDESFPQIFVSMRYASRFDLSRTFFVTRLQSTPGNKMGGIFKR